MEDMAGHLFIFALIYAGFVLGVCTDRLFFHFKNKTKNKPFNHPPPLSESGSVFTVLLGAVAMAGALSVILYQTMSGPMSSMVRITNKTSAKTQMQSVSSIVIMDAANNVNPAARRRLRR